MEGEVNYNIFYKEYYININISKINCILFNYNNVNIYTNIKEFFGISSLREEAINYFKKYIIDKVEEKYLKDVLDEFNYQVKYKYNILSFN
jgi:hypothetical protein